MTKSAYKLSPVTYDKATELLSKRVIIVIPSDISPLIPVKDEAGNEVYKLCPKAARARPRHCYKLRSPKGPKTQRIEGSKNPSHLIDEGVFDIRLAKNHLISKVVEMQNMYPAKYPYRDLVSPRHKRFFHNVSFYVKTYDNETVNTLVLTGTNAAKTKKLSFLDRVLSFFSIKKKEVKNVTESNSITY